VRTIPPPPMLQGVMRLAMREALMSNRLARSDEPSDPFFQKRVTDYVPKPVSDRWVIISWVCLGLGMWAIGIGLAQLAFYLDRIAG
jgi:hypothetical protein